VATGDNEAALAAGVFFDDRRGPAEAARWVVDEVLADREDYRRRARAVGLEHYSVERSLSDYRSALANLDRLNGPDSPDNIPRDIRRGMSASPS
jgi:hypothetical protein